MCCKYKTVVCLNYLVYSQKRTKIQLSTAKKKTRWLPLGGKLKDGWTTLVRKKHLRCALFLQLPLCVCIRFDTYWLHRCLHVSTWSSYLKLWMDAELKGDSFNFHYQDLDYFGLKEHKFTDKHQSCWSGCVGAAAVHVKVNVDSAPFLAALCADALLQMVQCPKVIFLFKYVLHVCVYLEKNKRKGQTFKGTMTTDIKL